MKKIIGIALMCQMLLTACSFQSVSGELNHVKQTALVLKEDIQDDFIPQDLVIVGVGDSLTEGVGDSTKQDGYLSYVQTKLENDKGIGETEIHNLGVKGNRTDQLIKRLKTPSVSATISDADIVLITIGGNDVMKIGRENFSHLKMEHFKKAQPAYERNIDEILELIQSANPDAMVVLVGLYNPFMTWFADIKEFNAIIEQWDNVGKRATERSEQIFFVEIAHLFDVHEENLLHTDNFHPNDKGYELIANKVVEQLHDEVLPYMIERADAIKEEENGT